MSSHKHENHKNTDEPTINDVSRTDNCNEVYPAKPIVHGVTIYAQIKDNNELYEWIGEKQREFNRLRSEPGSSTSPHLVASEYSPSWDKQGRESEIGLFASSTGYGDVDSDGNLIPTSDYHLGLYDDALEAEKPPLPAKCKLAIEKRKKGLQTQNGEFCWPPGIDGNRWEGTYLKIQTSYISNPMDAVHRAEEMLSTAFLEFDSLSDYGTIIPEMCRFQGLEVYIRYDRARAHATIRELEQSANLTVKGDKKGKVYEQSKNNECTNYSLTTTRMDYLGFQTNATDESPKKVKIKTYAAKNHNRRSETDPLRHWKLEAEIFGAHPWDQWSGFLQYGRQIVCSHAIWAGLRGDELVPDEWFLADDRSREIHSFSHPENRRDQLTEYYRSESFERKVRQRLFHSQTKSYYDVLCVLLNQHNEQVSYQEVADRIGLTRDSIGRIASELEKDGIVNRCISSEGFIRWHSQQAKDTVRELLDRNKTETKRRVQREERAAERRISREVQNDEPTKNRQTN